MGIETAFLEGALKESERVHMKCPLRMNLEKDECLEIWQGMCGLVQSARVCWLKMTRVSISPEVGVSKSDADQCMKKAKHGPIVLLLYVDDLCTFGARDDTNDITTAVRKKFAIKTEGRLKIFGGVKI